jgi:hypothetical protein
MSYRFVDSFRAGPGWNCQNEFVKLVHLVGFIIKKFVTMHGHMNVKLRKPVIVIPKLRNYFEYLEISEAGIAQSVHRLG